MMTPRSIASTADLSRPVIFSPFGLTAISRLMWSPTEASGACKHADQVADDGEAGLLDFLGERHLVANSRRL